MLSNDELSNGMTFILRLRDANGAPAQWIQSLRGPIAAQWYDVYRNSDWDTLRSHGREVFHERVTEMEAERIRRSGRCIVIHTLEVKAEEITPPTRATTPLHPNWENEGGSIVAAAQSGKPAGTNPFASS